MNRLGGRGASLVPTGCPIAPQAIVSDGSTQAVGAELTDDVCLLQLFTVVTTMMPSESTIAYVTLPAPRPKSATSASSAYVVSSAFPTDLLKPPLPTWNPPGMKISYPTQTHAALDAPNITR